MIRRLTLLCVAVLLLVTTGCTAEPEPDSPTPRDAAASRPSPFEECAALTAGPTAPADPGTASGDLLPELTLPCFTGGAQVTLREVAGPAVINIWASWCAPCREELPAFQRLSQRAAGQLRVIGVNNRDSREAAQSIGEDFGVRFPMLFDQGEALRRALRRNAFPLTVFVAADGRIRHIDTSGALDDAQLATLVRQHLDVTVPA
ncbi:TlpA family protein disulfide reductase [Micromonospora endophytica]|uniref:Alkyl hydroperoxide reductase n=1 Tax=Micromonospora endophytica TaxID=515350 RepID=A0A2W2CKH5_9ACTN|nr:TlpA disulfide reductase family protein [Micromonospora endophytica]PZF99971.1 alkyl hydroperoxide reductase [Micromonospora endophytica]RIW46647.1 TlpA family protein disulfide reductase [Micromonospora endophytica]BCJ59811.1 thiol:disulfide interchange protein [Micromonospora endophytica]